MIRSGVRQRRWSGIPPRWVFNSGYHRQEQRGRPDENKGRAAQSFSGIGNDIVQDILFSAVQSPLDWVTPMDSKSFDGDSLQANRMV